VVDDGSKNHLKSSRAERIPVRLELSSKVCRQAHMHQAAAAAPQPGFGWQCCDEVTQSPSTEAVLARPWGDLEDNRDTPG